MPLMMSGCYAAVKHCGSPEKADGRNKGGPEGMAAEVLADGGRNGRSHACKRDDDGMKLACKLSLDRVGVGTKPAEVKSKAYFPVLLQVDRH